MDHVVVDCRGLACPQPVIDTKKAIEKEPGRNLTVIVDNGAARDNVTRFARSSGYDVEVLEQDGCCRLILTGHAGMREQAGMGEEKKNPVGRPPGMIYFITSNAIGQGSPDLGEVLMKSLMVTLLEKEPPTAILFANTGVFLAVEGSPVLQQLRGLAGSGTEMLVCGTCLNYYKLNEKLAIGKISNMYEIHDRLAGPHKVITIA